MVDAKVLDEWRKVGECITEKVYRVPKPGKRKLWPDQPYALVKMGAGFKRYEILSVKFFSTREEVEVEVRPNRVTWKEKE